MQDKTGMDAESCRKPAEKELLCRSQSWSGFDGFIYMLYIHLYAFIKRNETS